MASATGYLSRRPCTQAQSDVMKTCLSYKVKLSNLLKLLATKDVLQVLLAIDIQKLYISNPFVSVKKSLYTV